MKFSFLIIAILQLTFSCGKDKESDPCSDKEPIDAHDCYVSSMPSWDNPTRTEQPNSTEIIQAQKSDDKPDPDTKSGTGKIVPVDNPAPSAPSIYGGCLSGFLFFDGNQQNTASFALYMDSDTKTESADKVQITYGLKDATEKTKLIVKKSERVAFIEGLKPGQYLFECSAVDPSKTPMLEIPGKQQLLVMYNQPADIKPQYFGCTFAEKGMFPGHDKEALMIHFHFPASASEIVIKLDGQKIYTSYSDSKILDETFKNDEKHKYTCSAIIGGKEVDGLNFLEI